jgi:hypothetical protein
MIHKAFFLTSKVLRPLLSEKFLDESFFFKPLITTLLSQLLSTNLFQTPDLVFQNKS